MDFYAGLFEKRRGWVATFVLVVTLLSLHGLTRLTFDDVPRDIFKTDGATYQRLLALYEEFGSDDNDLVLVLEAEDWFTPAHAALLRALADRSQALPGVDRALSLATIPDFREGFLARSLLPPEDPTPEQVEDARRRARSHPLVRGRLLSDDGRTTLVIVRLAGSEVDVSDIAVTLEEVQAVANAEVAKTPGVRLRTTGVPRVRVEVYRMLRSEQIRFTLLGSLVCLVLGFLLFRDLRAVLTVAIPPALGALWALGLLGLAGGSIDLMGAILPTLCMVIGFTDSVHLMIDVRSSRAEGLSPVRAAGEAIRHVGMPCALTSLTTAVGFGSLAFGNAAVIRRFGLYSAFAVFLAFLAVVTVMPLLASVLREPRRAVPRTGTGVLGRRCVRLIDAVLAHPRLVSAAGVGITVGLIALGSLLEPENRLTGALPRGEAYEALLHCEESFGGILPSYVVLEWPEDRVLASEEVLGVLGEVEELLADQQVGAPLSIRTVLASAPGGLEQAAAVLPLLPEEVTRSLARPDLRKALVLTATPDAGTARTRSLYGAIQDGLRIIEARHPWATLYLSGTDFVARTSLNSMILGLARSLGLAAFVIFGVIALEFRSIRLGLVSLLPNLFPLAVVAGVLVVTGRPLQMVSAVLFTVLLGLAVDDTIHFLSRHRRERAAGRSRKEAVRNTFLRVGKAISITTVVLVSGFAVVAFSDAPTNRTFGALIEIGLLAALIGDLVFLPALLALGKEEVKEQSTP